MQWSGHLVGVLLNTQLSCRHLAMHIPASDRTMISLKIIMWLFPDWPALYTETGFIAECFIFSETGGISRCESQQSRNSSRLPASTYCKKQNYLWNTGRSVIYIFPSRCCFAWWHSIYYAIILSMNKWSLQTLLVLNWTYQKCCRYWEMVTTLTPWFIHVCIHSRFLTLLLLLLLKEQKSILKSRLNFKFKILTKPCAQSLNKSLAFWPNLSFKICNKLLPTRSSSSTSATVTTDNLNKF